MNYAYILLGTNIGDKIANLKTACAKISIDCGTIYDLSSIYETSPWGVTDQPSFLNMVIKVETKCSAEKLLKLLLFIEKEMGRLRLRKWGERLIDLDILYFNNEIIVKENLKIPHPELHNRKFTLIPLCDIADDFKHPVFNITTEHLLKRCIDKGFVLETDFSI
ncbi:MAG TPA: 2-amino-4-hydroxy-6-hydroxymethyldihydropteridine diphosphokinase [Cytophagaceae bacterium]|jgi:2-amino-4-hydroxy-6-hydroxymethyldihydropteridine diphosphokinase|nr:2-amino-4-hydroxy-6-hydroxymethyldihydropteridine diphosphokinase [Cytophagaceae bacterium]